MSTALSTVARHECVVTIDNSFSSTLPDALPRPPESAPGADRARRTGASSSTAVWSTCS